MFVNNYLLSMCNSSQLLSVSEELMPFIISLAEIYEEILEGI